MTAWSCSHVSHAADPDELLEILGDELRPIVRDDPRPLPDKRMSMEVRYQVCVELSGLGIAKVDQRVVPSLITLLRGKNADRREWVMIWLKHLGSAAEPTVPALIARLRDESDFVRLAAIEALSAIGRVSAPVISGLIERLGDDDSKVCNAALQAPDQLGSFG
jgi:HEAT repeat protein